MPATRKKPAAHNVLKKPASYRLRWKKGVLRKRPASALQSLLLQNASPAQVGKLPEEAFARELHEDLTIGKKSLFMMKPLPDYMDPHWADVIVSCNFEGVRHISSRGDIAVSEQPLLIESFFPQSSSTADYDAEVIKKGVVTGVIIPVTAFAPEELANFEALGLA